MAKQILISEEAFAVLDRLRTVLASGQLAIGDSRVKWLGAGGLAAWQKAGFSISTDRAEYTEKVLRVKWWMGELEEGDRVLRDGLVVVKRDGICAVCESEVKAGTLTRATGVLNRSGYRGGGIRTVRACSTCCDAMASFEEDNGLSWREQKMLGWEKRRGGQGASAVVKSPADVSDGAP